MTTCHGLKEADGLTNLSFYCTIVHMNNKLQQRRFNYIVTFDERINVESMADFLFEDQYYDGHLVSMADMQSSARVIGQRYRRPRTTNGENKVERTFWRDMRKEFFRQIRLFR
jgi:hypothetical protein